MTMQDAFLQATKDTNSPLVEKIHDAAIRAARVDRWKKTKTKSQRKNDEKRT